MLRVALIWAMASICLGRIFVRRNTMKSFSVDVAWVWDWVFFLFLFSNVHLYEHFYLPCFLLRLSFSPFRCSISPTNLQQHATGWHLHAPRYL